MQQHTTAEECIGPSAYWKAQGRPVKIWGLLLNGELRTYVLPEGESMTMMRYAWLVENRMAEWKAEAFGDERDVFLVQDHERALWGEEAKEKMRTHGLRLLENFPKCSQDSAP